MNYKSQTVTRQDLYSYEIKYFKGMIFSRLFLFQMALTQKIKEQLCLFFFVYT